MVLADFFVDAFLIFHVSEKSTIGLQECSRKTFTKKEAAFADSLNQKRDGE